MLRIITLSSIGLYASISIAFAADLYVSPTGVDSSGRGAVNAPYQTINYAAARVAPGDTVWVRAGTYRETVTPTISGTLAAPITFRAYPGELVTLSGLDPVIPGANGAGSWSLDTGSIYRIQLTSAYGSNTNFSNDRITGCQVWVNGEPMAEARWPNTATPMGRRRTEAAIAASGSRTLAPGSTTVFNYLYRHSGLSAFAANAWTGGIIVFAPGAQWYRRVSPITGNTPNGTNSEVRFDLNPYNDADNREDADIGDPFFLMGRKVALDAEREFFFDTIQGASSTLGRDGPRHMLYLRLPGSIAPSGQTIEMRRRAFVLDVAGSASNLVFEDFRLLAGRIRTGSSTANLVFRGLDLTYPSYTWEEEFGEDYDSVLLRGTGHQFLDGSIRNSTNHGIMIPSGGNHTIRNTVISDCFLPAIQMKPAATNVRVENVTLYNLSATGITADARPNYVLRCHGYNSALFATDCGLLNAGSMGDALDSEWAYNWMHTALGSVDSARDWYGSPAIRLDAGFSGDGPSNFRIHHNVAWNTTQPEKTIAIWALRYNQTNFDNLQVRVYNNTVDSQIGFIETFGAASGIASVASLKGVQLSNNLTGVGTSIVSSSTDATGRLYLTDLALRNNLFPNLAIPNNPAPPHSANRQGATGWQNPASPPLGYQLAPGAQAIDSGVVIPGITDGFVGTAPDLGAFESGTKPFIPGAKLRLRDLPGLTVTPQLSGGNVRFLLTGLPPGRSLPDTFQLRIGGAGASTDFSQVFDFINHTVTATITAAAPFGPSQPAEFSVDGINYTASSVTPTVSIPLTFATWSAACFSPGNLANPALETTLWGRLADPDADGVPNLLEYALDGAPLSALSAPQPELERVPLDPLPVLEFHFDRVADPALLYEVQASDDLTSWIVIWSSTGAQNTAGTVTITEPFSNTTSRRFLRLRVSLP